MFDKIKSYFDNGLWDIKRVYNVVGKVISVEEFFEITDTDYESYED